jgi:hypothetical protein
MRPRPDNGEEGGAPPRRAAVGKARDALPLLPASAQEGGARGCHRASARWTQPYSAACGIALRAQNTRGASARSARHRQSPGFLRTIQLRWPACMAPAALPCARRRSPHRRAGRAAAKEGTKQLGPDGLSGSRSCPIVAARTAILYAFDLIEHDGEDLRNYPFLERKAALARLLRDAKLGILLNEHIAEDGLTVFAHACRLGAEGTFPRGWTAPIDLVRAASGSRSALPPTSPCSGNETRFGIDVPQAARANGEAMTTAKAKSPAASSAQMAS